MKEWETMEGSESQTLQPLGESSTSVSWAMKADLAMRDGYLVEACSRQEAKLTSLGSKSRDPEEAKLSELDSLDWGFEFFLPFEGISGSNRSK